MHEIVAIFVERHGKRGKIHLATHLKVEEVVVDVDTALHQVVIDDARVETLHVVFALAVSIHRAVQMKRAFQIVNVEARHVGVDIGADNRNRVFFHDFQRIEVGVSDDGLEVGLGQFWIAEIDQPVEIKIQFVVVNVDLAIEPVLFHLAVKDNLIYMVTKQFGIRNLAVQIQFGNAFLGKSHREVGVHIQFPNEVRFGKHTGVNMLSINVSRKHIGMYACTVSRYVGFQVGHVGTEIDIGVEVVV